MKIVVLSEGKTETVCKRKFKEFVDEIAKKEGKPLVGLSTKQFKGPITEKELKARVKMSLNDSDTVAVIALTDVYPKYKSAGEAKETLRKWVGGEPRFHPHAAQFDFEAWLIPYWDDICKRLGRKKQVPGREPEKINLMKPPSKHLEELYRTANRHYDKANDAHTILRDKDLTIAAGRCPELKSFLNTILRCAELPELP